MLLEVHVVGHLLLLQPETHKDTLLELNSIHHIVISVDFDESLLKRKEWTDHPCHVKKENQNKQEKPWGEVCK